MNALASEMCAGKRQVLQQENEHSLTCLPHLYSVPTTLLKLQLYLDLPRNTREAIAMFYQRYEYGLFLYLYRRFFPDDYAASQESEEIDESWNYSPREVEFLYLVSDRLFPLDLDLMSDAGANGERVTETIYLQAYDMPWWYKSFEHLAPGWQVLRLLSGTIPHNEAQELIPVVKGVPSSLQAELLLGNQAMAQAQPEVLKRVCAKFVQRDPPFSGFGQVLALYLYQTGNPWLDTDSDCELLYEGACWCEAHMKEIAQTYQEAQRYEEQVNAFANWLAEDSSRISQLLAILKEEVPLKPREETKRKVRRRDDQR